MNNVVVVPQWGRKTSKGNVREKFASCDKFIRSRIEPPPLGSVTFRFEDGTVEMTGLVTTITGDDCEIVIRKGIVVLSGSEEQAVEMFCSIHRAIEQFQIRATFAAEPSQNRDATA